MGIRLDQDSKGCHLLLEGVVDVFEARELHRKAVTALSVQGNVTVSMETLERLDTSAIQILLALSRALRTDGRTLHLNGLPPIARDALRVVGLSHQLGLDA